MPKTATAAMSGEVEWLGRYMERSQLSTSVSPKPRARPQPRPLTEHEGVARPRGWGDDAGRGWLGREAWPWSGKNCPSHTEKGELVFLMNDAGRGWLGREAWPWSDKNCPSHTEKGELVF